MWIGPDYCLKAGEVGFLVERKHHLNRWTRYDLRECPAHTNLSRQPRLYGWCGTNDDVATFALGLFRVVKVARNGRVLVERLNKSATVAALDELGYPELAKEED